MTGDDNRIKQSTERNISPWNHPPWSVPPWELPGGFRFDSRPHRGSLLGLLANVAFVCSILSYYPILGSCCLVFCFEESWIKIFGAAAVLSLFGSCLGLVVWLLARGDLQEMRTGLIDPEGKWETKFGHDRAVDSFGLGLGSLLLWTLPILLARLWTL